MLMSSYLTAMDDTSHVKKLSGTVDVRSPMRSPMMRRETKKKIIEAMLTQIQKYSATTLCVQSQDIDPDKVDLRGVIRPIGSTSYNVVYLRMCYTDPVTDREKMLCTWFGEKDFKKLTDNDSGTLLWASRVVRKNE